MTEPPVGKVFTQFVVNHINSQNLTNASNSQLQPSVPKIVIPSMLMIDREVGAPGVAISPVNAGLVTQVSKPSDSTGSASFPTVLKVQAPAITIFTKSPSLPLGKPGFLGLPLCVCFPLQQNLGIYWENVTYLAFIWVCACDFRACSSFNVWCWIIFLCFVYPTYGSLLSSFVTAIVDISCASFDAKLQQNLLWFWHDTLYLYARSFPIVKYILIVKHGLINLCLKQSNQSHICNYLAICGHTSFIDHLQCNWAEHCLTWL